VKNYKRSREQHVREKKARLQAMIVNSRWTATGLEEIKKLQRLADSIPAENPAPKKKTPQPPLFDLGGK